MQRLPSYSVIESYVHEHLEMEYGHTVATENWRSLYVTQENFEVLFSNIGEPRWYTWKEYRFPVFIFDPASAVGEINPASPLPFDPVLNAFLFLSGWQEWNSNERDRHGRFRYGDSLQKRYDFTAVPVVNIYFKLLAEQALAKGYSIQAKKKQNIAFSHDIDRLYCGWIEEAGYLLRNFSFRHALSYTGVFFSRVQKEKDPYFQSMQQLIAIEKQYGIQALYFFLASQNKDDADYDIQSQAIVKLLQQVKGNGHKIGLHPGLETYKNEQRLGEQKKKLEQALGSPVDILRQHFLQYDVQVTPEIQEKCGFTVDYSLGFAEHPGFRNGTCMPFYSFDFSRGQKNSLLEIPLFFMDGTLSHYLRNSREENFEMVTRELEKIREHFSFNFSILFHNTVFTEYKYKGFTAFYLRLLDWVKANKIDTKI
ncbi:MAG: hypothetical protein K0R65_65 [Crocinitomicaceae bacterium]|nr:hypothetical protein [Crocinitomicaceae bacterium]